MTENTQDIEEIKNVELIRRTRLRGAIDAANDLASRFCYAKAICILDDACTPSVSEDTEERLVSRAVDLRAQIIRWRKNFLVRAYYVAIAVLSIAIVGTLYFTPVSSVDIVANIKTDGLFAKVNEDTIISVDGLSDLMLNNIDRLVGYSNSVEITGGEPAEKSQLAVEPIELYLNPNIGVEVITKETAGGIRIESNLLSLRKLSLRTGQSITITIDAGKVPAVTLHHDAGELDAIIQTGSDARIDCGECILQQAGKLVADNAKIVRFKPLPQELTIVTRPVPVDYTFLFPASETSAQPVVAIKESIGVSAIDFTTLRAGRTVSLIREGSVEITEIDGRSVDVSDSEFVDFGEDLHLYVSAIRFGKPLEIELRGRVQTFLTGHGEQHLFSRMPSKLEWLLNNQLMTVFFSSVTAFFAFVVAAIVKLRLIERG